MLDLRLVSTSGLEIALPLMPNLRVGFHCHLVGPLHDLKARGDLGANGLYSHMLLSLYDMVDDRALRDCSVMPR